MGVIVALESAGKTMNWPRSAGSSRCMSPPTNPQALDAAGLDPPSCSAKRM